MADEPFLEAALDVFSLRGFRGSTIDQIAEAAGFEYALTQIRFTAGYGADNQHESVTISHALLAATCGLLATRRLDIAGGRVRFDGRELAAPLQLDAHDQLQEA